jgi:hypothetical protein
MPPSNWMLGSLAALGIIVLMSCWTLIAMGMKWIGGERSNGQFAFIDRPPHILIAGKRFVNERVQLDGHIYRDCIFDNVTFVQNG